MDEGRARTLFAGVVRLVPFSGVQMCDLIIDRNIFDAVEAQFIEEMFAAGGVPQRVLLPIDARPPTTPLSAIPDPAVAGTTTPLSVESPAIDRPVHPLSGKFVDPSAILTVDGRSAIDYFAGRWVPLPYLRFTGRDEALRPKYDAGPSNWVRAFVARRSAPDDRVRVTLAFDTSLMPQSRLDTGDYLGPSADDAAFGSTFICGETVDDVSTLLAEPWLEAWLARIGPAASVGSDAGPPQRHFQHAHIAHYLTLLRLFAVAGGMPEVRFVDTVQRRYPIKTTAVDLVIDIGDVETSAMLVDVTAEATTSAYAEVLRLRELSDPSQIHDGPFPTIAEFNAAPYGDAVLSRESGRLDAFQWPSLVRIGNEAQRLSLRANGTEGVTGLSNLRAFLLDEAASPGLWRQSTDERGAGGQGPMVSGELLGLIGENGTVLGWGPIDPTLPLLTDQRPAIRPRFSRASMMSFFAAELVLHALVQINAAERSERSTLENEVRELRQVIVLAPQSLSAEEQRALLARVDAGVALVWRGLGWDKPTSAGVPRQPEAVVGMGGDLGTQVAFLHNEVSAKYQGRFADLLRVYRGSDTAGTAAETLRVASVDFGARGTNLMIVDYAAADSAVSANEWQPLVMASERLQVGTDAALQSLIWTLVLPAIEAHLAQTGLHPAKHFLDEITGRSTTSLPVDDPFFTRRLNRKVLWPAARGLFALDEHGAESVAYGNREISLSTLVEMGGGRLDSVAAAFDLAALQAGARGFALAATMLDLKRGQIGRVIRAEMHASLGQIGRAIATLGCDLLLLGGEGARLPSLHAEILAVLPVPASRIVDLTTYVNQTAIEAFGQRAPMATAALLPALATAFDRRHLLELSGLGGKALRQLALAPPTAAAGAISGASAGAANPQRSLGAPAATVLRESAPAAPVVPGPRPPANRLGAVPAKGA